MNINEILNEIKRQFVEEENCTSYGEPQAWIYLDNGRSIEIIHEEEGLDSNEQYFSVRLHCTEEEFDNQHFDREIGVIAFDCSIDTEDCMNVDVLKNPIEYVLSVNKSEKVRT